MTPNTPIVTWADPAREAAFHTWLNGLAAAQGLRPDTLRPASADASFRRYLRVDTADSASRIVMDAPPDKENCQPFVHVAGLMQSAGLLVPEILAWDAPQGFMLLSDLGTQTMMEQIDADNPQANQARYRQAVDTLLAWQLASKPGELPPYDEALLRRELQLFPDWYLAQHKQVPVEGAIATTLQKTFDTIVARCLAAPTVHVHRDFMPRNLMIPAQPGSTPAQHLGVLDFQDAVYGPVTYDLGSLLRDAYIQWDEEIVLDWVVRARLRRPCRNGSHDNGTAPVVAGWPQRFRTPRRW